MRVLHLGGGNLFGGIETFLVALARDRSLCPSMEPHFGVCFEGRLSEELRATGAVVYNFGEVRFSRPWTVWSARRGLRRVLASQRFDAAITHACWPHSLFAPAVRKANAPLVFFAHDKAHIDHWLDRRAARQPPVRVIANSKWTAATVDKLFPGAPVDVVHPPVPAIPRREDRRNELRRELETPAEAVVISMTARMEAWKGHRLLLQALAEIRRESRWVCWIAGGGQRPAEREYAGELRQQALALGLADRIRWLGQRSDIPAVLCAADVHAQPNTGPEPFGIAMIEALWAGLPVVATRLGAAPELIDASCGILVEPENSQELSIALYSLIVDEALREKLGRRGPERARLMCDPRSQIEMLGRRIADLAA